MNTKRAGRRSLKYFRDHCQIIEVTRAQDEYGNTATGEYERILYDGKCFVSPGNMWPFETGNDVMRGARTDAQVYVPRDVPDLTPECIIEYDNHRYEVIAFANPVTAGATLNITARRV